MERQDAIYWITNLIGRYGKEYDEALEMAESALRQSKLIEDAVSRQQVIDTIMGEPSKTYYPCYFAEMIRELPSAQPATNYSEIPNGSDDTISRQAAIDDVCKMMYECFGADDEELDAIEVTLCELPAVQPDHVADIGKKAEGDCISRQAAIDALKEAFNPSITNFVKAKIAIDKLASAQPEIIRCKDCRFNDGTAYCLFHFRDVKGEGYCSWAERRTDG